MPIDIHLYGKEYSNHESKMNFYSQCVKQNLIDDKAILLMVQN